MTTVLYMAFPFEASEFASLHNAKSDYENQSKQLSLELDNILTLKNISMPDLFQQLAIK